eukprot:CAMPEP_0197236510 /NCGR_PEP_ID=MMETSP1429-20130617/3583_1 /TAXON_ID=49237 /ORGANISM="Chaetoceros  sp., Strain UNC1202" /LENGTH=245 /DNA_ID=CAMNT_0042695299 /DNA_START=89 /DNA_END=826 /DNA_ORIENTATION=+
MTSSKSKEYRKQAATALGSQFLIMAMNAKTKKTKKAKKFRPSHSYQNNLILKYAKEDAFECLLSLRALREDGDYYIPDQDRAVVNEAVRSKLDIRFIDIILQDYPRACESGGIVDHVNHPIHTACSQYRQCVSTILRKYPQCAYQRDSDGKLPLQLYIENNDYIDVSPEEFASTVNLLVKLNPFSQDEPFMSDKSLTEELIMYSLVPSHLKNTLNSLEEERDVTHAVRSIARRLSTGSRTLVKPT